MRAAREGYTGGAKGVVANVIYSHSNSRVSTKKHYSARMRCGAVANVCADCLPGDQTQRAVKIATTNMRPSPAAALARPPPRPPALARPTGHCEKVTSSSPHSQACHQARSLAPEISTQGSAGVHSACPPGGLTRCRSQILQQSLEQGEWPTTVAGPRRGIRPGPPRPIQKEWETSAPQG